MRRWAWCVLVGFALTWGSASCGSEDDKAGQCTTGDERCACFGNGTCNSGLTCLSNLCVDRPPSTGGESAGGTGSGGRGGNSSLPRGGSAGGSAPDPGSAGASGMADAGAGGGEAGAGGVSSGGDAASGGVATGGSASGGKAGGSGGRGGGSGGTVASGGAASGGAASGGTASGGAASGGAAGAPGSAGSGGRPVVIPPGDKPVFAQLELGAAHSCGLLTDGTVYCWGYNIDGMLGDGTAVDQNRPVKVKDLADVIQISAGGYQTCALMRDKTVRCWSLNPGGSLGSGKIGPYATPTQVPGLSDVVAVSSGRSSNCALLSDKTARCWGSNASGLLGAGSAELSSDTPLVVKGLTAVAEVQVGDLHACARLESGAVYCWGYNFNHQVSPEDIESSAVPLEMVGLPFAYSLTVGGAHSCAIIKKPETFPPYGNVMCWGANGLQQVGSAVSPGFGEPFSHIRAVMLAAGNAHNCATDNFGVLSCWGANGNGELGLGNKASPSSGSPSGLFEPPIVQIALGESHSCVLHQDGVAQCWGLHNHGQLGCGTNFSPTTPAAVQLYIP
ncbi:MAG TPA: hypothetical protein VG937_06755 [Polyangiaceae bacterium]|nr:hypothetical protein [Polyangiaceae bacterium]